MDSPAHKSAIADRQSEIANPNSHVCHLPEKWSSYLRMRNRIVLLFLLLCATALWAGIVESVRSALAQNNFAGAEAQLNSYRNQRGADAEYLEAYSWMGRAALDQGQYDQAAAYAKETKTLALEQLKQRSLDEEPHLPLALGAALEVQS